MATNKLTSLLGYTLNSMVDCIWNYFFLVCTWYFVELEIFPCYSAIAFLYIYAISKSHPHTNPDAMNRFHMAIQSFSCLQLLLCAQVPLHDTVLFLKNAGWCHLCRHKDPNRKPTPNIDFLLVWAWGGFFFLSHVAPCLACSQSSKEQMQEHIYKADLWRADTHEAQDGPSSSTGKHAKKNCLKH